ncbi:MAG: hypothetical protein AB7G38_17265 [Dehalococcoidia bacterium]
MSGLPLRRSARLLLAALAAAEVVLAVGCADDAPTQSSATAPAATATLPIAPTAAATATPQPTPIDAYLQRIGGTWFATVIQPGAEPYSMTLSITGSRILVDYPDLSCGGSLVPERLDGDVLVLNERIDYGLAGTCYSGGAVTIRVAGAELEWTWSGGDGDTSTEASAVLSRR